MLLQIRRRAFWCVSRLCLAIYRRLPLFGTLRASVAIIRQGPQYLAIRRNDGRGFSFPGGLAMPWESDEQALQREVTEETGLQLTALDPVLRYHSALDVPCNISVFRAQAAGQLRGSWEGDPEWVAISDLRSHLLRSQLPIIERLLDAEDS